MYGEYVAAVVRRAFQPTARFTDVLQILAASAAPAVARFLGVAVPTPDETLAYIGAAALAFVALRLFFVAPYQVWREQISDMAGLKMELSKPERMELARLSEIRAESKAELAFVISHMLFLAARRNPKRDKARLGDLTHNGVAVSARGNVARAFHKAFVGFSNACFDIIESVEKPSLNFDDTETLMNDMLAYLHGEITAEALALRLPPSTEPETQP